MKPIRALTAAVLLAATACGISPTDVQDRSHAPTISIPPPSRTIFMIKKGKLALEPAYVENESVASLLGALFDASNQPLTDQDTALRGFRYLRTKNSINPPQRDEIQLPRTSTLTVYISGEGTLTRLGLAQIVCTAQQDAAFEQVRIVRENVNGSSKEEGQYTCGEVRPR
ncbi:hypothetical protein AB0I81_16875 [Nonomuraea sp. NPDC050404]|uniref:hypothetical protein n=1 Tax=Nonomuraea sp. NPDC050404 TaxID=3155783 RepID=UPI003406B312